MQSKSIRVIADVNLQPMLPEGLKLNAAPRCFARSSQCLGIAAEAYAHTSKRALANLSVNSSDFEGNTAWANTVMILLGPLVVLPWLNNSRINDYQLDTGKTWQMWLTGLLSCQCYSKDSEAGKSLLPSVDSSTWLPLRCRFAIIMARKDVST